MVKVGYRKPSPTKSMKARTTGKINRAAKKAVIPGYGKRGMGWVNNSKKAAYNAVYSRTTHSVFDTNKGTNKSSRASYVNSSHAKQYQQSDVKQVNESHVLTKDEIRTRRWVVGILVALLLTMIVTMCV